MTTNRRDLTIGAASLGMTMMLNPRLGFSEAAAKPAIMRYGAYPDVSPYVWASRDWTGKYGVTTETTWYAGGGDVDNAMISGNIDIDGPGSGRVVTLAAVKPGDVSQIMVWCYGDYSAVLVAPNSSYEKMSDLKGKKIGTAIGSGAYMVWLVYLQETGQSLKDFQIINLAGGAIPAALSAGIIDAAVIWEPFPALMEFQKTGRIIQEFKTWVSDLAMLQTLNSTLEKDRDSVVKLVAGALDCQDYIRTNPAEAAKIVSAGMAKGGLSVPPQAFEVVIRKRLTWEPELSNVEPSLNKIGALALKLGSIPRAPKFNFRNDILDAAKTLRKA